MAHTAHTDHFASFAEFYPYYLSEHRNIASRRLHFVGSLGVIGFLAMALATGNWLWLPAAVVCGYGFAWLGLFFLRKEQAGHLPSSALQPDGRLGDVQGHLRGEDFVVVFLRRLEVEPPCHAAWCGIEAAARSSPGRAALAAAREASNAASVTFNWSLSSAASSMPPSTRVESSSS